jgi:hypothetical protein
MTNIASSKPRPRRPTVAGLLVFLVVAGSVMFGVGDAFACSGTRLLGDDMSDEFAAGDVVFTGTVIRRDEPFRLGNVMSSLDPIQWTFAVDGIEKGSVGNRVTISSPRSDASCGIAFALGQRYRVRAHGSGLFGLEAILGDADSIQPLVTPSPLETGGVSLPIPSAVLIVVLFGALAVVTVGVVSWRRSPSGDR